MNLVFDAQIIWLTIAKTGSPPVWQQGVNYRRGDIVVPTVILPGQENIAFQCVGFRGKSGVTQPVFPLSTGQIVEDGDIEWKTVNPEANPLQLSYDQYYLIDQTVTVS